MFRFFYTILWLIFSEVSALLYLLVILRFCERFYVLYETRGCTSGITTSIDSFPILEKKRGLSGAFYLYILSVYNTNQKDN